MGDGNTAAKLTAVIESIVFLLQVNLELMTETAGKPAQTLIVSGGLARLDGLCQRLADLGGTTVMRPEQTEATARGLAWLMAGPLRDLNHQARHGLLVRHIIRRYRHAISVGDEK